MKAIHNIMMGIVAMNRMLLVIFLEMLLFFFIAAALSCSCIGIPCVKRRNLCENSYFCGYNPIGSVINIPNPCIYSIMGISYFLFDALYPLGFADNWLLLQLY
jgi:hypothetical protein